LSSPDVCHDPAPSIKVIQYGDYGVIYDIKFWLYNYDRYPEKRDAVMTAAWYHLHRAGIMLSLPIRQVYMHQVDPIAEAGQRHAHIASLVATLRRVDLFAVLDDTELHTLAEHAGLRLYGRDEVLARQGD